MAAFDWNPQWLAILPASPEVTAMVDQVAADAEKQAQAIAPTGSGVRYQYPLRKGGQVRRPPGSYRASIRHKTAVVSYPGVGRTAVGRVYSRHFAAGWIENGTAKFPARRILHRGALAARTVAVQV